MTKRREEVEFERRPVSGRSSEGAEIGSGKEEVRIPITEEQVFVEKRTS